MRFPPGFEFSRLVQIHEHLRLACIDLERCFTWDNDFPAVDNNKLVLLKAAERTRDNLSHCTDACGYLLIRKSQFEGNSSECDDA